MRRIVIILLLAGCTSIISAQSLKDNLFNIVNNCYNTWKGEEFEEDGEKYEFGKIEYDIPNGYVETSGSWPTCGCGCEAKAAAFKDAQGEYTYVVYEEFDCNDYGASFSNKDIIDIMPEGFGLETFAGHPVVDKPDEYSFQATFDIPRSGTDMDVHLRILPLGSVPNDMNGLTFVTTSKLEMIYDVRSIAKKVDNTTLLLAVYGKFDKIPSEHKKIILDYYSSMDTFMTLVAKLKKIYDIYQSLDCLDIKLKWNRQTARFEIKSKDGKPRKCSFKEFLTWFAYASYRC
ncbi:MAG: hypothetical protein MJZ18_05265 [Bacteroidales bacterium]|nr:hypothetical protein [Bacteroidales bacterium]